MEIMDQITKEWKQDVYDRSDRVDPENGEDWYSLALGYALGKGHSPEFSIKFANYIRYETDFG